MKRGQELVDEINALAVTQGGLCFWWLGQHSFVVKTAGALIYLDPYLASADSRTMPPLLAPEEVTNADIVTGSHDHADHIDKQALPGIMAASPASVLVAPRSAQATLEQIGLSESRVRLMDDEETTRIGNVDVTAIKAAHELVTQNEQGHHEFLSFIIETGGVVIYHAGDTCLYDGMATRLKQWDITIAFLPINGRDAVRLRSGCIGNMTYQEAVDLAGVLRPCMSVPAHYEMFASNSEDPALFADYMDVKYPDLQYWVGEHGVGVRVESK